MNWVGIANLLVPRYAGMSPIISNFDKGTEKDLLQKTLFLFSDKIGGK